jgi:hypothetical protein
VTKLRHSGISTSTQATVITSIIEDLKRTIQILEIDISTEEERVQIFDKADPLYSTLARTLALRRDNLSVTVADLEKRLVAVTQAIRASISEAAWSENGAGLKPRRVARTGEFGRWLSHRHISKPRRLSRLLCDADLSENFIAILAQPLGSLLFRARFSDQCLNICSARGCNFVKQQKGV